MDIFFSDSDSEIRISCENAPYQSIKCNNAINVHFYNYIERFYNN